MPPLISVNLPVYNGARTLERQLKSILGQSFGDFQLLITDNASTDGTEDICRAFAALDQRIVYRRNPRNLGFNFSFARNLHNSLESEFMIYASANDYWHPDYLAECLNVLKKNPDAAAAYSWCQFVDENGRPASIFGPGHPTEPYRDDFDLADPSPVNRFLRVINELGMCTFFYGLFRLEVWQRYTAVMYRPNAAGDNYFLAALALSYRLLQIPKPLFFREIPALDASFFERQARLLKFNIGDRETPEASNIYLTGFLDYIQAHEALFTDYGFLARLTPAEKESLVSTTSRLIMERYSDQLLNEIRHNAALVGRGCFYAPPAAEGPAPEGGYRTLDFLALSHINTALNRYIDYFPEVPGLYHALALTLVCLGRLPEAIAALEEELKNNPTRMESLDLLARLRNKTATSGTSQGGAA